MLESIFQSKLIKQIKEMFPGCLVLKNDATYIQGIPDLTILYKDKWALLECKRNHEDYLKSLKNNPNQKYYVDLAKQMCFGSYIYPEIKEEVLYELQQAFGV